MAVRRDKLLTIKTTEAERSAWQAEATTAGLTLADLIRSLMSAKQVGREPRQRRRRIEPADPALLAMLGRLNGNMNSLAHWASTHKTAAEAVQVLAALTAIDKILSSYRPTGGSQSTPNAD